MKRLFICIVALCAMIMLFPSCDTAAPEINFSHTTTVSVDLTDVIDAINDMSLSMDAKLDLINQALTSSQNSTGQKLDVLAAAINSLNVDLSAKLGAIETAIKENLTDGIKEAKEALLASIEKEFAKTDSILGETNNKFDEVNRALAIIGVEEGIYPESNRDTLYMHPAAWEMLYKDETLTKAFTRVMTPATIKFTVVNHRAEDNYTETSVVLDVKQAKQEGDTPILMALPIRTATGSNPRPVEAVRYAYSKYVVSAKLKDQDAANWEMTGGFHFAYNGSGYPYYAGGGALNAETGYYDFKMNMANAEHRQTLSETVWPLIRKKQQTTAN